MPAVLLHVSEDPNESVLLGAELTEQGIGHTLSTTADPARLAAIDSDPVDALVVDVPLRDERLRTAISELQRRRPLLPVVFRWGHGGFWSTQPPGAQLAQRLRDVLPVEGERPPHARRPAIEQVVGHQELLLRLSELQFWDFEPALRTITESVAAELDVDRVSVWEFDADRASLRCLDLFERAPSTHSSAARVLTDTAYIAALESSLAISAPDARLDPRTSGLAAGYLVPLRIMSMLDAPVRGDGRVQGVLCLEMVGRSRQWSLLDQCMAAGTASLVSRALDTRSRRELAEQVRHAERLEAVGRVAAGLAHDFNNYLTGILGYTELGLQGGAEQGARDALVEVRAIASRARDSVADLLGSFGPARSAIVPTDLYDLAQQPAPAWSVFVPPRIALSSATERGSLMVEVSLHVIERMVTNLVKNAVEAIPDRGAIVVRMRRLPPPERPDRLPPGEYAVVEVEDTGPGIDADTQSRLFEMFFTTKVGRGCGIGLATVMALARQHEGTVTVRSTPSRGSTFGIVLPLHRGQEAAPDAIGSHAGGLP
jgi:signal transduction histidine kinase